MWQGPFLPLLQVEGGAGIRSTQAPVRVVYREGTRRVARSDSRADRATDAFHRRSDLGSGRLSRGHTMRRTRNRNGVAARGISAARRCAVSALGRSDRSGVVGGAAATQRGCRHRAIGALHRRDARGRVVHVSREGRCCECSGDCNGAQTVGALICAGARAGRRWRKGGGGNSMNMQPVGEGMPTTTAAPVSAERARSISTDDRSNRRAQFESEALTHLDALYSFALKLTHERDEAEDLVSETMLRAFDRWEQYQLGTNVRAWLFTILYHAFVSRKRRIDAREVRIPEDEDGRGAYEIVGEADPEGKFYDSFMDDEITRAIDSLPEDYRLAVVLSDVQGLRYAEIANILGIPEGTVKSRLFRGRRVLQKKLAAYAVEMGYIKPRPAIAS